MTTLRRRNQPDRRRQFRAEARGAALLHTGGAAVRGELRELGLGGARVTPRGRPAGTLRRGATIGVELAPTGSGWSRARAVVVRDRGGELGLRFVEPTPALEDAVEELVLAAVESARAPRVLVVDADPARRRRTAARVRAAGARALEAATALDAIVAAQAPARLAAALLADDAEAAGLAAVLRAASPGLAVRRGGVTPSRLRHLIDRASRAGSASGGAPPDRRRPRR